MFFFLQCYWNFDLPVSDLVFVKFTNNLLLSVPLYSSIDVFDKLIWCTIGLLLSVPLYSSIGVFDKLIWRTIGLLLSVAIDRLNHFLYILGLHLSYHHLKNLSKRNKNKNRSLKINSLVFNLHWSAFEQPQFLYRSSSRCLLIGKENSINWQLIYPCEIEDTQLIDR